ARLLDLARIALRTGDEPQARQRLLDTLTADPTSDPAVRLLGRLMLRAGEHPDYLSLLQGAASARGESLSPTDEGELCEVLLHDDDAAFAAYQRAFEADPTDGVALRALTRTGLRTGRFEALASVYQRRIEDDMPEGRKRVLVWRWSQLISRVVGSEEAPVMSLERFAAFAPDHVPTLVALAVLYESLGRYTDAVGAWTRVASFTEDPDERRAALETRAELAAVCLEDTDEVKKLVNELVSACPDSVAAWSIQRQALLTARDYAGLV